MLLHVIHEVGIGIQEVKSQAPALSLEELALAITQFVAHILRVKARLGLHIEHDKWNRALARRGSLGNRLEIRVVHQLDAELGWYTDSAAGRTLHVFTPAASLKAELTERMELELDWPTVVTYAHGTGMDYTRFLSGNPWLTLYAVWRSDHWYLRVGGGVAAPLVDVDPGRDLVEDRKWFSEEEFQQALAVAQTMPGPLAAQTLYPSDLFAPSAGR